MRSVCGAVSPLRLPRVWRLRKVQRLQELCGKRAVVRSESRVRGAGDLHEQGRLRLQAGVRQVPAFPLQRQVEVLHGPLAQAVQIVLVADRLRGTGELRSSGELRLCDAAEQRPAGI